MVNYNSFISSRTFILCSDRAFFSCLWSPIGNRSRYHGTTVSSCRIQTLYYSNNHKLSPLRMGVAKKTSVTFHDDSLFSIQRRSSRWYVDQIPLLFACLVVVPRSGVEAFLNQHNFLLPKQTSLFSQSNFRDSAQFKKWQCMSKAWITTTSACFSWRQPR